MSPSSNRDHWKSLANALGAEVPDEPEQPEKAEVEQQEEPGASQAAAAEPAAVAEPTAEVKPSPSAASERDAPVSEASGQSDAAVGSAPKPSPTPPGKTPPATTPKPSRQRRESHWGFLAGVLGLAPREAAPEDEGEDAAAVIEESHAEAEQTSAPAGGERQGVESAARSTAEAWDEIPSTQGEALDELNAGIDVGEGDGSEEGEEQASSDVDEERRPRRRRRRRRGRGRHAEDEAAAGGEEETVEHDSSAEERAASPESSEIEVVSVETDDEAADESAEETPRRSRRRRGRGRDRDRREPAKRREKAETPSGGSVDEYEEEVDESDEGDAKAKHRKIPTWKEAIGMLIDVNMEGRSRGRRDDRRGRGRGGRR